MSKELFAIGGVIWGVIGLIVAVLDLLTVFKFGLISMAATNCAQSGNVACLPGSIETIVLFAVDVVIGPLLLATNLMTGPLGILGVIIGLAILFLAYAKK
jgi:hypothetical protein